MSDVATRRELEIPTRGAVVLDSDGDVAGTVEDVLFDAATGRLDGIVLRAGGMLRTFFGGGERIHVSAAEITAVDEQTVRLNSSNEAFDYLKS
jgi:sporulation protein YlmC with PRC-barrel domain